MRYTNRGAVCFGTVLWPENGEDIATRIHRAGLTALAIQSAQDKSHLGEGVDLSVKIGIGVGVVSVLHLGGVLNRMEYVAVGEPLVQAFAAEHHVRLCAVTRPTKLHPAGGSNS